MPLTRYEVRNEYSLADPELYKAADKDDPEALLEGVAMAGLVGVLRQLGDLAEFAAEIFHDLHEEVMVTAARGHTIMVRVQQLESEFPPIEKAFLSQTSHSTFFFNSGTEWNPNLQMNQNLITKGDLPRFVMDSYEEARGPPRLFLLDKFDIAGAGSCLKRYTDPSFYKVEASFVDMESVDVQRDKKFRKAKKKGPRWKHGETPELLPSSKLHQLFLEEQVESGSSDPARLVKLKRKSSASAFSSENGKSYMDKFLKTPPEDKVVHEVSLGSSPLKLPSKSTTGSGLESQILDVSNVGPDVEPVQRIRGPYPPPSLGSTIVRPSENDFFEDKVEERTSVGATSNSSFDDKEINVDERENYHSDCDDASEIENYMDALATMESEVETDTEFRSKKEGVDFLNIEKHGTDSDPNDEQLQSQSQFSDSQSIGNSVASDDGNNIIRKGLSSFSYSDDTASTSAEDTTNEKVRVDQLPEHEASENACTELAEIHVDKAPLSSTIDPEAIVVEDDKSEKLESDDASSDSTEILSDPTKTEEQPMDDENNISSGPTKTEERLADEGGEMSSGVSKIKEQSTDDDGNNFGGPTETEEQLTNVDCMLQRRDEITPTLSYEEHLEDESELEDSFVDSSTLIDTANIVEEIHEKEGSENSFEDVVQTKFVEEVLSPDSVISHPEEQLMNDKSNISSGPTKTEERLADEGGEISSGLSKIDEQSTDENGKSSGGPTETEEQLENVDDMLQKRDEITATLPYEENLEDSYVDSSTVIDATNILEEIHEKEGSENSLEYVLQTKFVEDFSARNSVDTQIMLPDSVTSQPEEQPSVLHLERLAENTNDDISDKVDSAEVALVYSEEIDLDGTRNGKLSQDSDNGVEEGGIEPRVNLMAKDFLTGLSGYQDPSSLADDHSQSNEREDKMVHTEDEFERGRNSSLLENHAQSDEREEGNEQILESESPLSCSHVEETDVSLSSDCIPILASLEKTIEPETGKLDLQPVDTPESYELSSQLEPIDDAEFDSFALTMPSQPLEQEKALQVEELDVGPTQESCQLNLVESNEAVRESWPGPISGEASLSEFPQTSCHTFDLSQQVKTPLTPASVFPGFNLLPEVGQLNLEEMPPLPPLPPMQWRIGKFQQASVPSGRDNGQKNNPFSPIFSSIPNENVQASNPFLPLPLTNIANSHHENLTGNMVNSTPFLLPMPTPNLGESRDDYVALKEIQSSNPFAEHAGEAEMMQPIVDHSDSRDDFLALGQTQSSNLFTALPETCYDTPHQVSTAGEEEGMVQPTDGPFTPAIIPGPTSTSSSDTPNGDSTQSPNRSSTEASLGKEEQDHSSEVSEMNIVGPPVDFVPHPPVENRQPEHVEQSTEEEIVCSSSSSVISEMTIVGPPEDFVPHPPVENRQPEHVESTTKEENICSSSTSAVPSVDDEKPNALPSIDQEWPNGNQIPKLPRPRSPLIDAVIAHDKSKLRKVTERVQRQEDKVEEKDSVLEQIRTKSFNLKPAVSTRPIIQGPRTNLRVAAILEKANAIRQAFAGSDDDEDSWSDS